MASAEHHTNEEAQAEGQPPPPAEEGGVQEMGATLLAQADALETTMGENTAKLHESNQEMIAALEELEIANERKQMQQLAQLEALHQRILAIMGEDGGDEAEDDEVEMLDAPEAPGDADQDERPITADELAAQNAELEQKKAELRRLKDTLHTLRGALGIAGSDDDEDDLDDEEEKEEEGEAPSRPQPRDDGEAREKGAGDEEEEGEPATNLDSLYQRLALLQSLLGQRPGDDEDEDGAEEDEDEDGEGPTEEDEGELLQAMRRLMYLKSQTARLSEENARLREAIHGVTGGDDEEEVVVGREEEKQGADATKEEECEATPNDEKEESIGEVEGEDGARILLALQRLQELEQQTAKLNEENDSLRESMTELSSNIRERHLEQLARLQLAEEELTQVEWDVFTKKVLTSVDTKRAAVVFVDNLFASPTMSAINFPRLRERLGITLAPPEAVLGLYTIGVDGAIKAAANDSGWYTKVRTDASAVDVDVIADVLELFIRLGNHLEYHFVGCDYGPWLSILAKARRYDIERVSVYGFRAELGNATHRKFGCLGLPVTELPTDIFE